MGIKVDLAAIMKMMISSQEKDIETEIEKLGDLLSTAEHALQTSYERLAEEKALNKTRNVMTIEAYITYLNEVIASYTEILNGFTAVIESNAKLTGILDDVLKMDYDVPLA